MFVQIMLRDMICRDLLVSDGLDNLVKARKDDGNGGLLGVNVDPAVVKARRDFLLVGLVQEFAGNLIEDKVVGR